MNMLGIESVRADPDRLDGRLTVYAKIDVDPAEMMAMKHPIASAVHNGMLVAQGNFKDQSNLRDFLQSEMGLSLEEGLEEIIERLDGLESALDPQKLRDKIENMREFEEFIPTPAKIVPFHSEEEILSQEGDVFFVGTFKNIGNANLSVNSFPILYQARYREQQVDRVRGEIEQLIAQIEGNNTTQPESTLSAEDVREKLLKEFIPEMLDSRKNEKVFRAVEDRFRKFMRGYKEDGDVNDIVRIISLPQELGGSHFRLLELYAKKIGELRAEHFEEANKIQNDIVSVRREIGLSE